jgi:hypothetical protein
MTRRNQGFTKRQRAWFTAKLTDVWLLDHAIVLNNGDLAVPVGGERHGGFICADGLEQAQTLAGELHDKPGFPNITITINDDPEVMDNVSWGDTPPPSVPNIDDSDQTWAQHDVDTGRYYGYSEKAIYDFVTSRYDCR